MLDQDFCTFLEYQLSTAFISSTNTSIKYFWCDGILLPTSEKDLSKKSINAKKFVATKAFVGEDGQDEYELILSFGSKSLSRYARGLDLKECVPNPDDSIWYFVDPENKKITVQLL